MAADGVGNVWAAATIQNVGTGLYKLLNGTSTGQWTGGGLNTPYKTFVDGNDSIWVANGGANTVSGFSSTSSTWMSSVGFSTGAAAQTGCLVLAVDPSGDVWTGNSDQSVTQLLGLATPTAAPLYGGRTVTTTLPTIITTTNGNLGTKP
jgi:streptogramin lyase